METGVKMRLKARGFRDIRGNKTVRTWEFMDKR